MRGRKQLLLFPFVEYEKLYPFPVTHPCDRQSMVDVARPDLEAFPAFATASGQYTMLQPADLLANLNEGNTSVPRKIISVGSNLQNTDPYWKERKREVDALHTWCAPRPSSRRSYSSP